MSSDDHAHRLHTYCQLCGFPFEQPSTHEVCTVAEACKRRLTDPTYRVPPGRLAAIEERVRQFLVEKARATDPSRPFHATVTYGDLCEAVDPEQHYWKWPRFRGIGPVLGRVSTFEHQHGRPLLSALVVHAGSRQAGDGFAGQLGLSLGYHIQAGQERAFWRSQVEEVVRYWAGQGHTPAPDPTARALALLANISQELQEVRRLLGAA